MGTLTFLEARTCVLTKISAAGFIPPVEEIPLADAAGRVLAEDIVADRDYPPLARSGRDGYAVRAADVPGELRVIGEVRAGQRTERAVARGEAIEIMTGAPVPAGADAVVMVEHTTRDGDRMRTGRSTKSGEFINPQGSECRAGAVVLERGTGIGYAGIAMLATVGRGSVVSYRKPTVAILATGDEIVEVDGQPEPHEIRNSNAHSLMAQVERYGGEPLLLPVARDNYASTLEAVEAGLASDLLLLSGGVSAGKYDIVERVLADCGAEFFFDRVLIQPGQPLVFGKARGKFLFGLPGNPGSTMVTFELFGRAAVELLGGRKETMLPLMAAKLTTDFRHKTGLTRFLPARLSEDGSAVTPVRWQGSSDVPALARSNAFLVAEAEQESWKAGEWIRVLWKGW